MRVSDHYYPARAVVDLSAIRENIRTLAQAADGSAVMAIIKADAYGHGLIPVAHEALAAGATWLGVAQVSEALSLRRSGITAPILTWLYGPGAPFDELVLAGIDLSVASLDALARVHRAALATDRTARIHVKVDTGLGRGGLARGQWDEFRAALRYAVDAGGIDVVGLWSHLAFGDEPGHPFTQQQLTELNSATRDLEKIGLTPQLRHLAASGATLREPSVHLDLVRPGVAIYGLTPMPEVASAAQLGLRPAMRLVADLATVKPVTAGQGVSYGHQYVTDRDTVLGIIPLGYADGIPRHLSGTNEHPGAPVHVAGPNPRSGNISGRVCMDQVVVDLGPEAAEQIGDRIVLFGDPALGDPSAQDWAERAGTINYEITTRLGARVPRVYTGHRDAVADQS